jgi:PhnB protein
VDDGRLMHAHIHINGASLMLHDEFPEYVGPADVGAAGGSGLTLHLQVDNADTWFDRAVAAGARAAMPVEDMFWGDRYGQVVDPFGYRWSIGHAIKQEK